MRPKASRRQNAPLPGGQQATSARKYSGSQRAQTRATMTTEYQERFLPPHCHTTVVSTSSEKAPYHSLKGTSMDTTTFRSCYVTHKWIKNPAKPPQPPVPPKGPQRCSSAPHDPACFVANQLASKVEDYTSVYKNDFRAWKTNKRQPYRLGDSLRVNHGLVVTNGASKDGRSQAAALQVDKNSKPAPPVEAPQPIESVTSYRSDYITHPLQPRAHREKPANQRGRGPLLEPAASCRPKLEWHVNQELFDGASELFQQFKTWSLETKFHGQGKGKAKASAPPEDQDPFLSTTHADYTPHKCPRTKPILPSVRSREQSKEPFHTTTTMKEDYKAWDTPRRLPAVRKEDWPKKAPFSVCRPKTAEACRPKTKPFGLRPVNASAICGSSCDGAAQPLHPSEGGAFSGFECITNGTGESRMYWSASMDRGVTWADGDEPSQPHQIISCMVSSRS